MSMNGSRPAPSSPEVEKSMSGPERNPGSRPGIRTAAAITANATGLQPRPEGPRRRDPGTDHTGPERNPRGGPGTGAAGAIPANAPGLEPRTEAPRRRDLEPDHTGPHWRTR